MVYPAFKLILNHGLTMLERYTRWIKKFGIILIYGVGIYVI